MGEKINKEKSIMWDYIYEQPQKLKKLLNSNQIEEFLLAYDAKKISRIMFVASGSSLNAATVSRKFFEDLADVIVGIYSPFEFMSFSKIMENFDKETTLVVAVSQTGTSNGVIMATKYAKSLGFKALTITETKSTQVHALGDYYLNLLCDLEDCNAKTKGYTSTLTLLRLLALKMGKERESITKDVYQSYIDEIKSSFDDIDVTINMTLSWLETNKDDWCKIKHFYAIGSGMNHGSAAEGMLKLMETLCIPASYFEIGEFSHGPYRTLSKDSNVITIYSHEYGYEEMKKTNEYLAETVGKSLIINATKNIIESDNCINIAYRPLTASSLNAVVVFQVLAVMLPECLGEDPNRDNNEEYTKLIKTRGF